MPYYRRRRSAPYKTDKHEVTFSNLAADFGTTDVAIQIATGVASADKNNSIECEAGSHIKALYLEMNIAAETVTNPKVMHWELVGAPGGITAPSPSLYYQSGRNRIIKRGMEMLPRDVATVFKRIVFVRIPKKFQRIGQGDSLYLIFRASSTESINACGFVVYKEIY